MCNPENIQILKMCNPENIEILKMCNPENNENQKLILGQILNMKSRREATYVQESNIDHKIASRCSLNIQLAV